MSLEIIKQKDVNILSTEPIISEENLNIMNETYNKFNLIKYTTEELNYFKDNLLTLLKERDKIYLNKLYENKKATEQIKSEVNSENKITNSKFSKIIDTQAKITSRLDQLNEYETFVSKTNEKLTSHEVRLTNIRNDFSLATQKYDKIYLDNLEVPGYIGRCAKYKNCQVFFLDVIKDLAKLNIYREKNILDLKMYKDKLETIISSMNSILDNNNESQMKYINEMKEKIVKDCESMFESVTDKMKEIRVENSKYAVDLISNSMDLSKKWDKLEKIKEELLEKFNYNVNKYQMLTDDTIKSFEEFKNEYSIIRRKFMELAEFIKDVRFRKNIGGNVKKKEVKQMVKKIMKKKRSFENENVQLLSDITSIENIDYKKYYNFEENNNDDNNENLNNNNNINDNNNIDANKNKNINTNKKKNINEKENQIRNRSSPKEIKNKKDMKEMNQSAENKAHNNKFNKNIEKEKDKNKSSRSVNANINLSSINNKIMKNKDIINNDTKNVNNNLVIDSKNLKTKEEELNNNNYDKNRTLTKNKDSNIIKLVKNVTENKYELRNIINDNDTSNKSSKENEKESITVQYSNRTIINDKKINESKPSLIEEASTISDVKNYNNKDNKFSSEKSISFISDSNGNNINKFLINDIHIEQNDKIIKELASELEQSTAKKDKFEQKFKNACNNIEPINLLGKKDVKNNKTEINIMDNNNKINDKIEAVNQAKNNRNVCEKKNKDNKIREDNIRNDNENTIRKIILDNKVNNANNDDINNNTKNDIQIKEHKNINNGDLDKNIKNDIQIEEHKNINNYHNIIEEADNNSINKKEKKLIIEEISSSFNNNNNNEKNNSNINNSKANNLNSNSNINICKNEPINNLNPIKINNEIHLNDISSSNSVAKKLHAFDQKLLNLELYTKEKIIELISQINLLKQNGIHDKNIVDSNNTNTLTPSSNKTYKTFNNSFINQNQKLIPRNSFNEKIPENFLTNNENNKNILNINNSNNQNFIFNNNNNFNLEKKRFSLKNVNPKQLLANSKFQRKNSISYNVNNINSITNNNKIQNNSLTENNNNIPDNNNNYNISTTKNNIIGNPKEIMDSINNKILQNLNNNINLNINNKLAKDTEKKTENVNNISKISNIDDLNNKKSNNKSLNYGPSRNNNYNDSSFNGAEIKLVDLNKLVNHQLPRNRLIPIHINENDYFELFKNK